MNPYTKEYYRLQRKGSLQSAREVIPILLKYIQPSSVIDFGCGVGTWLSAFKELGVQEVTGVDGYHIRRKLLQIPKKQFIKHDLSKPLLLNKKFDLVVSLEVAEHLPAHCAKTFIDSLTAHGPVILFSAALPHQGGLNHVNEQWAEYWAELFRLNGYVAIDCIRREIWRNPNIAWWYAQNTLLYVDRKYMTGNEKLMEEYKKTNQQLLSMIHPAKYMSLVKTKK